MSLRSRRSPRGHLPAMYRYCISVLLGFLVGGCNHLTLEMTKKTANDMYMSRWIDAQLFSALILAGPFKGRSPLQPGILFVKKPPLEATGNRNTYTSIVVNVAADSLSSGTDTPWSYRTVAEVDCSTSDILVGLVYIYGNAYAVGKLVDTKVFDPPLVIENDINNQDTTLTKARDIACKG